MLEQDDFLKAAYKQLGGKPDVKANELFSVAKELYWQWRDNTIFAWACAVYGKHGFSLLPLAYVIIDLMDRVDSGYCDGMMSSDCWAEDEDAALSLAHAVGALRWHNTVRAGRVAESLPLSLDEAQAWLDCHSIAPLSGNPAQMSLFLD